MKFNCVISNTTIGGQNKIFQLLRANSQEEGARHIFIVPDRFSLSIEKSICEEVFPDGSFFVDVVSFTRLAKKALGSKNKKCLSKEGTVLLLNRVIKEVNSELNYYKNVQSLAFSREMFASIASLRSSNVSVDDINKFLDGVNSDDTETVQTVGITKDKLRDIAIIYDSYNKSIREKYFDTITRIDWLNENLYSVDFIRNSHIYVTGFNVFSGQQLSVIKQLIANCPSVSVSFCIDDNGSSNSECFNVRQKEILIEYCREKSIPIEKIDSVVEIKPPFDVLHKDMFGFAKADYKGVKNKEEVRIYGVEHGFAEVKAVAKEIAYLVYNKGCRYRDIAVVNSGENYLPIIKSIFSRCDIPYFVDEKYYVKRGFLARYILGIASVVEENYAQNTVLKLIRNPYFDFSRNEIQLFENYCIKYNVNYNQFLSPFTLCDTEEEKENLVIVEKVRQALAEKISIFNKVDKVSEFCERAVTLAKDENLQKVSERLSTSLEDDGEEKSLKKTGKDLRLRQKIELKVYAKLNNLIDVLDEIKMLNGDETITVGEFATMVENTIDNTTESVIPQYLDSVFVGDVSDSRFEKVKYLFVIGANEGNFPKISSDQLILSYCDTEIMKANGLTVYPTPIENNAFAQFEVIDLLTKANRLYVTYTNGGEKGGLSSGVKELKYRLGIKEKPFIEYHNFSDEKDILVYNFVTPENCCYEYVSSNVPKKYRKAVEKYLRAHNLIGESCEKTNEYNLLEGYETTNKGEYKISVSKMESYFECPFNNFLKNVLKLKEREEGNLKVNDKGSLIHSVMENFFRIGAQKIREANDEELRELIEKSINETFNKEKNKRFTTDERNKADVVAIKRECRKVLKELTTSLKNSQFNPLYIEKRFGDNGELSLEVDGKKFVFTGIVDRVDVDDNNNIIIIDYKTGHIYPKLENVYVGEKIQLYLYLKYFLNEGFSPAGVFYLPIKDGYKKDGVNYAMEGQINNDIQTFINMDSRVKVAPNGKYKSPNVNIIVNKEDSGVQYGNVEKANIISESDFRAISDYCMELCTVALKDIMAGDIDRNPIKDKCKYCSYKKICGDVDYRVKRSKKASDFYVKGKDDEVE